MTIHVVGLGPGGTGLIPRSVSGVLEVTPQVIIRTSHHPAAATLADHASVRACDDLYDSLATFDDVYEAIVTRVLEASTRGDVVYAVPGSPFVGERSVRMLLTAANERDIAYSVHDAPSFLNAIVIEMGIDPLSDGLKVLDGRDLPRPLTFEVPTIIGQVDLPEVLAEALASIDRVLPEGTDVAVLVDMASDAARITWGPPSSHDPSGAGLRTSLFVPAAAGGLAGAIATMERLREECPWDREQTHRSLVRYLMEETAELADAIASLDGSTDWTGYSAMEDELGDVLLQVLFHAEIARRAGAFDISDVAERLRLKLVRRHPHVFADTEATDADQVRANWDAIKASERRDRGEAEAESSMDGVPHLLDPLSTADAIGRAAARVGFDWADATPVFGVVSEELEELIAARSPQAREHELGDLLFSVVNLARHLDVDPGLALRGANQRFGERFRKMEQVGPLDRLSLDELQERWSEAKRQVRALRGD